MDPAASASVAPAQALHLERELIAREAAALKRRLDLHLAAPGALELDASQVERVDACGLQLLLAFVQARRDYGAPCAIARPSPVFERAVRTLGLQSHLGVAAAHACVSPS
jgi:anti-anti-sigma regulatory factor